MNIIDPRPMSLCISADYCKGYNDAARKANENKNLIDGEKFRKFIDKLIDKYGEELPITSVFPMLEDFMNMTDSALHEFYFT